MRLALDLLGGDRGPEEVVKAANRLLKEKLVEEIYLVGPKSSEVFLDQPHDPRISWVETENTILMNDHPAQAYRLKKDASITLASRLVKEGKADALVSCGSTGGQLAAGLFEIGRIKGVSRPAIAAPLPKLNGGYVLLLDAGANTEASDDQLSRFASMGSICYTILYGEGKPPRLGLINNGSEENKGPEQLQGLYQRFSDDPDLHFVGFAEGNDLLGGRFDVLVTDGFTGNIILKTLEGTALGIFRLLKAGIMSKKTYQIGAFLLKPLFKALKNRMDANQVGGAPLLGIQGISVVCHGHSDAEALYHGCLVAKECFEADMVAQIIANINK